MFIGERTLPSDKNFKAIRLSRFQKLAVLKPRPALITNRENIVFAEVVPQQMRQIFVEPDSHATCYPRRERANSMSR